VIFQVPKPFEEVGLQWFAEGDPDPGPGGEPSGEPAGEPSGEPSGGGEPPTEPPVPKYLSYAPDKYKKDPEKVKDLAKHKSWGEILDRMYEAESKLKDAPQVPESPDAYEFSELVFPEELQGDEHKKYREAVTAYVGEVAKEIAAFAHENGLNKEAAKAFGDLFVKQVFAQEKAARDAYAKAKTDGEEALKTDWKANYDSNAELARRAIQTFGKDELEAAFKEAGVENHPAIIKAFYEIGKAIGEDTLVPGSGGPPEPSPEDKEQQEYKDRYKNSPDLIADAERAEQAGGATPEVPEELKGRYPSME